MNKQQQFCPYCGGCQERYYSVETAAQILDCPEETVRYWIKERRLGSVKFGRLRRIPARELEKMGQWFPSLKDVATN